MGSRHTFVLGASGYLLFIVVNFVPSWYVVGHPTLPLPPTRPNLQSLGLLLPSPAWSLTVASQGASRNRLPPALATAVNPAPALTQPIAPATSVLSLIGINGLSEANVDKICEAAENLVAVVTNLEDAHEQIDTAIVMALRESKPVIDGVKDQYNILIKFDIQSSTNSFYNHFNGRVMFVVFVLWKTINSFSWLSTHIVQLQVELDNLHAQYVLNDVTKALEAFLLQYATILFTVLSDRNGQTLPAQLRASLDEL
ncbi:hypothetical protein GUJ93_ZPchr0010g10939 [Zizania palustris]|uniref:BRCA1-associated 2/ETP1 RRM domain-containing protein n=1 Tax=Zizania palustris TaxID=103762 RepID=A0A8J5WEE0_ZIZPA|nr:hypothetical protein GUJ93_ZPchr0010g10939 [Zizania palustris]